MMFLVKCRGATSSVIMSAEVWQFILQKPSRNITCEKMDQLTSHKQ